MRGPRIPISQKFDIPGAIGTHPIDPTADGVVPRHEGDPLAVRCLRLEVGSGLGETGAGRGAVGYSSSHPFRPKGAYATSVETSVYLDPAWQGRGLGARLYAALFDALASEDVHRAYAGITLPNPASLALHPRFGFEHAGTFRQVGRKHDRYWDVAWYEKSLR